MNKHLNIKKKNYSLFKINRELFSNYSNYSKTESKLSFKKNTFRIMIIIFFIKDFEHFH